MATLGSSLYGCGGGAATPAGARRAVAPGPLMARRAASWSPAWVARPALPTQRAPVSRPRSPRDACRPCPPRRAGALAAAGKEVGEYADAIMEKVRKLADKVTKYEPAKAAEDMDPSEAERVRHYVATQAKLLLLEADEDVVQHVQTLKDWPLKLLQSEGRVLLDARGALFGDYYDLALVRFSVADGDDKGKKGSKSASSGGGSGSGTDDERGRDRELPELPKLAFGPGDTVTICKGAANPLMVHSDDLVVGVVTEKGREWIKVAVSHEDRSNICDDRDDTWRLDLSVNTLTYERALLALPAMWHGPSEASDLSNAIEKILVSVGFNRRQVHGGSFEGSSLRPLLLGTYTAASAAGGPPSAAAAGGGGGRDGAIWADGAEPALKDTFRQLAAGVEADGKAYPPPALAWARQVLPDGEPDPERTAEFIRELERGDALGKTGPCVRLDPSQCVAIATVLLNPLVLLHGPPGIGKTTTICSLMRLLRFSWGHRGRALMAAQSNVAVDNVLEGALNSGLNVIRIGKPVRVRGNLVKRTLRHLVDSDPSLQDVRRNLRKLRDKIRDMNEDNRRQRGSWAGSQFYLVRQDLDKLRDMERRLVREVRRQLLAAVDVVGTTCTGAGGPELRDQSFDLVIIDEGSQASEPEALIPVMKGSRHLLIVGDHKQLPPVVQSRAAQQGGLDRSLFERLMHAGAPSAMLQVQYRMHPSLSAFPNAQFYGGLLADGVRDLERPRPAGLPFPSAQHSLLFVDVDGSEDASLKGSHSNKQEAEVVVRVVKQLVAAGKLRLSQIGIISPYAAQVALMARMLPFETSTRGGISDDADGGGAAVLECKSVDGYQGREKDVIIFSAVRSNTRREIGFLRDWRRLNVAVTRARRALVVVGSRSTLRSDEHFGAFVKWAEANGCVVEPSRIRA